MHPLQRGPGAYGEGLLLTGARVFLAGATGATGQVFVPLATEAGLDLVLNVRPQTASKSPLGRDPRAKVFDLSDAAALADAARGADVVVSLVGTMRDRFKTGDTYEASDVLSTEQLVAGAKAAGVGRMLLLSSLGAGGFGAYLKMKGVCEQKLQESGLRWSIFRPSVLVSPIRSAEPTHGRRAAPPGVEGLFSLLRVVDRGRWTTRLAPIPIDVLVRAMLHVIAEPRDGEILEGRALWELGEAP